jgi:type II secretory pathway predicted ATPase ExeA
LRTYGTVLGSAAFGGVTREIFSQEAYVAVTRASHGVPRRINNICDLCLLDGSACGAQMIDDIIVKKVQ